MKTFLLGAVLLVAMLLGGAMAFVVLDDVLYKRREERDRLEHPDKTRWNSA